MSSNRGDTLLSIARRSHVPDGTTRQGQRSRCLGQTQARPESHRARLEDAAAAPLAAAGRRCRRIVAPATKLAAVTGVPPQTRAAASQRPRLKKTPAAETPAKANEATGALPTFRWPVRGKVITSYGAKTNGKSNRINLAVPKALREGCEDGVVAYSATNLKGMAIWFWFGTPNGYVTAYAHASNCW